MTTVIRAAGAADFLALLPRLVGFVPTRSVVLVPFAGNRTLGALRLDLPSPSDIAELDRIASTFIGLVCKVSHADAVGVIVYTDDRVSDAEGLPHDAFVRAVVSRADLCGLGVSDALCVAADAWGSYLDTDLPAGGRPLADIPYDDDAFSDLPMDRGDQASGTSLPLVDLAQKERVGRVLARIDPAQAALGAIPRTVSTFGAAAASPPEVDGGLSADASAALAVRLIDDPPDLFEDALAWDPGVLHPARAAAIVWCLARPLLRDVALVQWATDIDRGDEVLAAQLGWSAGAPYPPDLAGTIAGEGPQPDPERLAAALELCRRAAALCPRDDRPGPLSACAWLSWALGRSTHAGRYAEMALDIDPSHGMAGIVMTLVASAHLPEWAFERPAPPTGPVSRLIDSAGVEGRRRR